MSPSEASPGEERRPLHMSRRSPVAAADPLTVAGRTPSSRLGRRSAGVDCACCSADARLWFRGPGTPGRQKARRPPSRLRPHLDPPRGQAQPRPPSRQPPPSPAPPLISCLRGAPEPDHERLVRSARGVSAASRRSSVRHAGLDRPVRPVRPVAGAGRRAPVPRTGHRLPAPGWGTKIIASHAVPNRSPGAGDAVPPDHGEMGAEKRVGWGVDARSERPIIPRPPWWLALRGMAPGTAL